MLCKIQIKKTSYLGKEIELRMKNCLLDIIKRYSNKVGIFIIIFVLIITNIKLRYNSKINIVLLITIGMDKENILGIHRSIFPIYFLQSLEYQILNNIPTIESSNFQQMRCAKKFVTYINGYRYRNVLKC